jgi:hypothetical protein
MMSGPEQYAKILLAMVAIWLSDSQLIPND